MSDTDDDLLESLSERVLKLQQRIDQIIDVLLTKSEELKYNDQTATEAINECLEIIFPGRKDKFCRFCYYTDNWVLDSSCDRDDCGRF